VDEDKNALDREILDTLTGVSKRLASSGQVIAAICGVSPSDLQALFKLDDDITMKELAQRMGCDSSYVTTVADSLEKQGLIRREPGQHDRRIKKLVLTSDGLAAKERMLQEMAIRMPWSTVLDETERQCFLTLLKKIVHEVGEPTAPISTGTPKIS
jgi:MarR family transcriptional regulator, organic hydroperoxide resistance regulator